MSCADERREFPLKRLNFWAQDVATGTERSMDDLVSLLSCGSVLANRVCDRDVGAQKYASIAAGARK